MTYHRRSIRRSRERDVAVRALLPSPTVRTKTSTTDGGPSDDDLSSQIEPEKSRGGSGFTNAAVDNGLASPIKSGTSSLIAVIALDKSTRSRGCIVPSQFLPTTSHNNSQSDDELFRADRADESVAHLATVVLNITTFANAGEGHYSNGETCVYSTRVYSASSRHVRTANTGLTAHNNDTPASSPVVMVQVARRNNDASQKPELAASDEAGNKHANATGDVVAITATIMMVPHSIVRSLICIFITVSCVGRASSLAGGAVVNVLHQNQLHYGTVTKRHDKRHGVFIKGSALNSEMPGSQTAPFK